MTKTFIIDNGQKPTEEQLREVKEARKSPIVFDEDCEELSACIDESISECCRATESK